MLILGEKVHFFKKQIKRPILYFFLLVFYILYIFISLSGASFILKIKGSYFFFLSSLSLYSFSFSIA